MEVGFAKDEVFCNLTGGTHDQKDLSDIPSVRSVDTSRSNLGCGHDDNTCFYWEIEGDLGWPIWRGHDRVLVSKFG